MATITKQWLTCDGYNVSIVTGDTALTLHFLATPSEEEITSRILETELRLLNEAAEEEIIETEEELV